MPGVEESVDAHLITQFSAMMHVVAQQAKARMRGWTEIRKMTGDTFAYDSIGSIEARELFARFNPAVFDDINHSRRQISKRRFTVNIPMDDMDLEGMLTDPTGQYAQATVRAMERKYDRVVYDALFATVNTGRNFTTPVTASTDGVLTVDATGGLTLAKILEIKHNFINNEVGNDIPTDICYGITGDEHSTLLQIDQFISSRYTTEFALQKGVIVNVAGIDLIPFGAGVVNPLLTVTSGNVRRSFALARDGVCVGLASDGWKIKIQERTDFTDTKQLNITGTLGAVRTEGVLVQQVNTDVITE